MTLMPTPQPSVSTSASDALRQAADLRSRVIDAVAPVIVGQRQVLDDLLVAIVSGGHCLLEGVPGLAKTTAVKALANAMQRERAAGAKVMAQETGRSELECVMSELAGVVEYAKGAIRAGKGALATEKVALSFLDFPGKKAVVEAVPRGVVGIIAPWNYPLHQIANKVAAALAAGCTVVLKPSEVAPINAFILAEIIHEAGVPAGVFNLVTGVGPVVGEAIAAHADVDMVSFTGSTRAGKRVAEVAAQTVKKVALELGGKSANIIFEDTDIEAAAASAPGGVFDNAGQDCCARTRILVQKSVFDKFMSHFEKSVKAFRCEDPNLDSAGMGPLISKKQKEVVESYIDNSVAFKGSAPSGPGYWVPPTVLLPKDTNAKAWREEIFGPVVAVLPFTDEADAIAKANDSIYGLSGSIFTSNLGRAMRVARAVESGNLSVNSHSSVRYWTPFGGYKQSGLGRALGPESLDAYTETKNVFFNTES